MHHYNDNYDNLFLCGGSAGGSLASALLAMVTQSNIAWAVSIVAGLVAIVAGVQAFRAHTLTIKEKKLNIEQIKKHNKF